MCGIAGALSFFGAEQNVHSIAYQMQSSLYHRGPDRQSFYYDEQSGVLLIHARLAIQDLSQAGNQPMTSVCGRYVMIYNGEIYNHLELRKQLECETTIQWQGHSDTETLLMMVTCWGLEKTLSVIVGMFAIALWDKKSKRLELVRDRMGEKPLYYGRQEGVFLFASELKALKPHPAFQAEIDSGNIMQFLQFGYIPAPQSIYRDINKCEPGHQITLDAKGHLIANQAYWSLSDQINVETIWQESQAINHLEELLVRSITEQQISDVPLGAFLSGGIDSSTIVALMQHYGKKQVKTFSIGFEEQGFNEARAASDIASYLDTDHCELYVSAKDAMAVIPQLPMVYDEPFADSSQIPTWLVARLAKESVKVVLSGDGGDELFAGYSRYVHALPIWQKWRYRSPVLKKMAKSVLNFLSPSQWDQLFHYLPGVEIRQPGYKIYKLADLLNAGNFNSFYYSLVTRRGVESLGLHGERPCQVQIPDLRTALTALQYMDVTQYLPGDILTKVDRAAMSHSLEVRIPLLDHRIVEFAFGLPDDLKIRAGQGKWLLRQVLRRYLPEEKLFKRSKSGFAIPLGHWLGGSLRDWAENLLSEEKINRQGILSGMMTQKIWHEHLSGRRNHQDILWHILMLQAWLEHEGS